jgi:hypothetical protein
MPRCLFDPSQSEYVGGVQYYRQTEETIMPLIDTLILTAICIGFVGFALVLAWGDYQTANFKHRPTSSALRFAGDQVTGVTAREFGYRRKCRHVS